MRDINQNNFGDIVIGDFGIAKIVDFDNPFLRTYIGTSGYMAPEVLQRVPYCQPADIWSVGIISHAILVGNIPFKSHDQEVELVTILKQPINYQDHIYEYLSDTGIFNIK
jgi:calcium/calmodulin-dependent protein kinase I